VKTLHRGDDFHDELIVSKASLSLALAGESLKNESQKKRHIHDVAAFLISALIFFKCP
jgi:hypothetical protein